MSTPLEDFLAQAREGGQLVSSGCFTLDVTRANRILRDHQAASPEYFLVKFIQAAVAGRMQGIDIGLSSDFAQVTWLGATDLAVRYEDVIAALSSPDLQLSQEPLAFLACGLNAALSANPARIEWRSYRENPATLCVTHQGVQLQPLRRDDFPHPDGIRADYGFLLQHGPIAGYGWWDTFRQQMKHFWLERIDGGALKKRLGHCPIRVRDSQGQDWDTATFGEGLFKGVHLSQNIYLVPDCANSLAIPRQIPGSCLTRYFENDQQLLVHPPSNRRAWLVTGVYEKRQSMIRFFHYGVELERITEDLGEPAFEALATTEGLKLDLGQTALVRDDELRALVGRIAKLALTGPS